MKKYLNNKVYDTSAAKEVGSWDNGANYSDFTHTSETLYQKRTGEFFLHGEGGPMSKYAQSCGQNEWSGGEKIIPLTYENAQKWAQEHLDGDQYETIFGAIAEDESAKTVTFRLSLSSIEKLKRESAQTGRTMSEILDEQIKKL